MIRKTGAVLIFIILCCIPAVNAQTDLQLGARPQGMGGAYIALANNADAAYWNPAGLCLIRQGEAVFMHWNFAEISNLAVDYLSLAYPMPFGAVGFSWVRQAADLEEGYRQEISSMSENHFLLSYGIPVTSRASLGMGLKRMVINSKIGNGAGIGLEFGALYRLSRRYNWTVAAVARDVAANLKNESLNPYYMVGTAYQYHSPNGYHHLAFALDAGTRNDVDGHKGTSWRYAAGMEYLLRLGSYGIALRGGGGTKNYAFGFGLRIGFFAIDYAFTQMRENTIGDSHKFGISFNFGRMAEQEEEAAQAQAKERQALKVTPMRLTGAIRGDRIVLRWDKVRGSDEYKVFGRMPGQKWKSLFEKRLKKTDISINYRQKSRRYEFMVVAVKKGKGIGKSNVWATL